MAMRRTIPLNADDLIISEAIRDRVRHDVFAPVLGVPPILTRRMSHLWHYLNRQSLIYYGTKVNPIGLDSRVRRNWCVGM